MKDFDHLMSVWQGQPKQEHPSVDDVLKQVKKGYPRDNLKDVLGHCNYDGYNGWGLYIDVFMAFKSPATTIGILIIVITIALYLYMIVRHYHILNKRDLTQNPMDYLDSLKEYQKNRTKVVGWFYYIYILLLSAGLGLYFIEILENASLIFKLGTYGFTFIWFMFTTFYLKPRMFKNEEEKLNLMIDRLERLQDQFD